MNQFKEKFVVNENGDKLGVFLDMPEYQKILSELEELEVIRAFDSAEASDDEAIPFDQAVSEIEQSKNELSG